jgi:hypothetical protein
MWRAPPRPGSSRSGFSDEALVELVFACGIFNWGNKFNITMRLDTDGTTYPRGMRYRDASTSWRRGATTGTRS